jgi:hypothetical protein
VRMPASPVPMTVRPVHLTAWPVTVPGVLVSRAHHGSRQR